MDAPRQTDHTPTDGIGTTHSQSPPGLATLARRIARWSGNLLATAVIIILGLTFGRQVLWWWNGQPAGGPVDGKGATAQLDRLADPDLPHQLAFGDLPLRLNRSVFVGDENSALARLRDQCRRIALDEGQRGNTEIEIDQAVRQRLETYEPVEQGQDWQILQHRGPVITVVALRTDAASAADVQGAARKKVRSVLSWGLGLKAPQTETTEEASSARWTLFTCSGSGGQSASARQLDWPLPPRSRRTLAMQVQGGGALIGFVGQGDVASGKQFFDQSLTAAGWSPIEAWTRMGAGWHARFAHPRDGQCDVQLRDQADGGSSGILNIQAAARDPEK